MLNFFSGLSLKAWLCIAASFLVLGFVVKYQHNANKVVDQKATIKEQSVTIATQQQTIETGKKIDKIDNASQVMVEKEVKQQTRRHVDIQTRVENTTRDIEQRFTQLPVTAENIQQEQQQLSTARIDGIWDAYCTAAPTADGCKF